MTSFGFLSTYPPTRCGLATFTESLATAIVSPGDPNARIVRMMDELAEPAPAALGSRTSVAGELSSVGSASPREVRAAARLLDASDVVIVQHEYGIFGGTDGVDAVRVMEVVTVPSIVVLHTVLDSPTPGQRFVLERIVALAAAVVVMTATAARRLSEHYTVDTGKVSVIAHGVPAWTAATSEERGHRTVLTWGLIGPGKGIEHGIRAIAELADVEPEIQYIVAGQTHPKVVAHDGEIYRESLHTLVSDLGVGKRVDIRGEYLDPARLAALVASSDVILLPYDSRDQVTSGVLVEAIAAAKPVIATAFPHAVELLGEDVGLVVPHEDPAAIAQALRSVLPRAGLRPRAHPGSAGGATGWADIAPRYRALAETLIAPTWELSA